MKKRMKISNKKVPSLRWKFGRILAIFALLPTVCLGILISIINTNESTKNGINDAEQVISQISGKISSIMLNAESTALILSKDATVQIAYNDFISDAPLSTALDNYKKLNRIIAYLTLNSDFYNIRLYMPDYPIVTNEEYSIFSIKKLEECILPYDMQIKGKSSGWTGAQDFYSYNRKERIVSYYCTMFPFYSYTKNNSIIAVDISTNTLTDIFSRYLQVNGTFIIRDSSKRIIVSSFKAGEGDTFVYDKAVKLSESDLTSKLVNAGKEDYYFKKVFIGSGEWSLSGFIPINQFYKGNRLIILALVIVMIVCLCVIPVVSYLTAGNLVIEIKKLTTNLINVKHGKYDAIEIDASTKEVQLLQETHNSMVETIDSLIHDIYEERIIKQEVQMDLLYAQIKPHFLYNTLESAKWMALKEGAVNVAKFIENISLFFRLTLNRGHDWVTLEQEMQNIRAYIEIMNARYHNRITFEISMDENIKKISILKLITQPLVENSILHGIYEKDEAYGHIEIKCSSLEGCISICIVDNGKGIDDVNLQKLNDATAKGFGVANIRRRLRLYYGDSCRLIYENNIDCGTKVTMLLPMQANIAQDTKSPEN